MRRNGSSLELLINGTSDKLTVASFFDASGRYVVESAVFADGTVWDEAALRTAALNIDGSEASETLSGYDTNDKLRGTAGTTVCMAGPGTTCWTAAEGTTRCTVAIHMTRHTRVLTGTIRICSAGAMVRTRLSTTTARRATRT
ncbi:calcium-binding protein [Paenibacillus sp. FSL R5-0912]|uniref:calcium-binding protein n=1 Tax=Paenibacillus sp. FSL R5-0912 TaxID=1536771 RepID=UPI0030ED0C37